MAFEKTITDGAMGEITEKKSRFIATIQPVSTEEEAVAFIAAQKKKYYDARHNCSAYIIGRNGENKKSSDDGEPSGTAGRPMLEVLEREGIYNVCVVVTRYFGGTLLGTGGLVRAYQGATKEALANCNFLTRNVGTLVTIDIPYTLLGKVQYLCSEKEIPVVETKYETNITMTLVFPAGREDELSGEFIRISDGTLTPELGDQIEYAVKKDGVLLF